MNRHKSVVWVICAVLALSLVGCGAKQKAPEFQAQYYPECYDPIAKLCKDQDNSEEMKTAAKGAAIGALGGAVAGGLISGDWKGAAIGAAGGAVAGGLTGFFTARLSKISDQKARLAEYQKMLGESSKDWNLKTASVEKAYKCYREQIKLAKEQYKAKKISKEEFRARMAEIKAGIDNINTYWADAKSRINDQIADSEDFLKQQEAEAQKIADATKKQQALRNIQKTRTVASPKINTTKTDVAQAETMRDLTEKEYQDALAEFPEA